MSDELPIRHAVDLLVFDFDGVLTDNRVYVFDDGREAVSCNRSDGLGFDMFRLHGVAALILSTETNPVVSRRAEKLKVPVLQGSSDKAASLQSYCAEQGVDPARTLFVGNDVNDLPALRLVGWPVAVADAHAQVLKAARIVLRCRGGDGAAREIAERVLGLDHPAERSGRRV